MGMKIYHDKDVDVRVLRGRTIAVIGYGIQGAAQAQNLRDSGEKVIVGARQGGPSWERAKKDGMEVASVEEAARRGDIIFMLTPDMTQKEVYERFVKKHLGKGDVLYFSHGFNITFGRIVPPSDVDVIMVAPKGPGKKVRETYLQGFGTPALFAVHQNASGKAKEIALALAKQMGFTRAGVFEATFDQETYSDLFGEQTVLCGGLTELIKAGYETLVEDGFPPVVAYFEVLHEIKLISDLIHEGGLEYMWSRVSETARYGGRTRGPRVIDAHVRENMKRILEEIKSGQFAKEWIAEYESGMKVFEKLRREGSAHPIEKVGAEIRKMFEFKR